MRIPKKPYIRDGERKKPLSAFDKSIASHPWLVIVLGFLGILLITLGTLYIFLSPSLEQLRRSLLFVIVLAAVQSGTILFFTFRKTEMPHFIKATLAFAALSIWAPFVIHSPKVVLLLDIAVVLLLIACAAYCGLFCAAEYTVLTVTTCYLCLRNMLGANDYSFVASPDGMHFWQTGIVAALLGVIAFVACVLRKKIPIRKWGEFFSSLILSLFICFCIGWLVPTHLNYALDPEPISVREMEIVEAEVDMGHRKLTRYIFRVDADGKRIELQVPQSVYYAKSIGDRIEVSLYGGCFDDAFYIVE